MYKLVDKIYCKETEYKICSRQCTKASHVVRRLITGVFRPSGYLDATLTGQAPRAHLQEGKPTPVKALNAAAKDEIISKKKNMFLCRNTSVETSNYIPTIFWYIVSLQIFSILNPTFHSCLYVYIHCFNVCMFFY